MNRIYILFNFNLKNIGRTLLNGTIALVFTACTNSNNSSNSQSPWLINDPASGTLENQSAATPCTNDEIYKSFELGDPGEYYKQCLPFDAPSQQANDGAHKVLLKFVAADPTFVVSKKIAEMDDGNLKLSSKCATWTGEFINATKYFGLDQVNGQDLITGIPVVVCGLNIKNSTGEEVVPYAMAYEIHDEQDLDSTNIMKAKNEKYVWTLETGGIDDGDIFD